VFVHVEPETLLVETRICSHVHTRHAHEILDSFLIRRDYVRPTSNLSNARSSTRARRAAPRRAAVRVT
jgi:hypothetical protein